MTDLNKQELRRLAEMASPAYEWYAPCDLRYADDKTGEVHGLNHDDDSFISAANPAAILSLLGEVEALRKDAAAIRRQFEYWKQRARSAEGHIYSPKSDLRCAAKALQPRTRLRDRAWHDLSELEQYELMLAAHDVIRAVDQSRHARRPKDMSVISASSCGGPACCHLCADEAGEVGNG